VRKLRGTKLGSHVSNNRERWANRQALRLVLDSGRRLWRVQVKSTASLRRGMYCIPAIRHVCGQTVTYQASEVDFLAAHVTPDDT
jgi:hypothetical protein